MNWVWIVLTLVVIAIDFFSSDFIYSWFGIGFVTAFLLGFVVSFKIQLLVAILVGGISIIIGMKFSKKYIKRTFPQEKLLMGKYIGKDFIAEKDIYNEEQVKINGVFWYVKNVGTEILKGEKFKVISSDGNKLIVKKGEE